MVFTLAIQMVGAVNQKRYRACFYASICGMLISILLFALKYSYEDKRERLININKPEDSKRSDSNYLVRQTSGCIVLVLLQAIQLVLFSRRDKMSF